MLTTFLDIVHIFVCGVLMFVVLLQQGKGGGMGAAFGGGAAQQVFGGRGAGNILTRATAICAGIFMLTSVSLAYLSTSGDRELRQRVVEEQHKKGRGNEGTPRAAARSERYELAPLPVLGGRRGDDRVREDARPRAGRRDRPVGSVGRGAVCHASARRGRALGGDRRLRAGDGDAVERVAGGGGG